MPREGHRGCLKGLTLRPAPGCTFHQARGTAQRKPGGSWVLIRAGVTGRRDPARERWKQENIPRVEKEKEGEEGGSHTAGGQETMDMEHALNCWLYFKRPTIIISSRRLIGWKAKRSYSVRTGNRESGLREAVS